MKISTAIILHLYDGAESESEASEEQIQDVLNEMNELFAVVEQMPPQTSLVVINVEGDIELTTVEGFIAPRKQSRYEESKDDRGIPF